MNTIVYSIELQYLINSWFSDTECLKVSEAVYSIFVFNMHFLSIKIYWNDLFNCFIRSAKLVLFIRYYRYVLDPDLTFEPNGMFKLGLKAVFTELPQKSVLTLGMKCPESWMVESVKALYDLDNILLEEVGQSYFVKECQFEL